MSRAYQSTLGISFDVRGGLLIRQVHHWSADLFVAAVCIAGITLYGLLWATAAADEIAYYLHISLYTVTWVFRVAVLVGPVVAFALTRMICHVAQARRRDEAERGVETGRIVMTPEGGFTEIREPAASR